MQMTVCVIDPAKNVLQLHGVNDEGIGVVRTQLTRPKLLPCVAQLVPCRIGMAACQGAPYWARAMRQRGHAIRLSSPQCVPPYRQSHKNDPNDAALCITRLAAQHLWNTFAVRYCCRRGHGLRGWSVPMRH